MSLNLPQCRIANAVILLISAVLPLPLLAARWTAAAQPVATLASAGRAAEPDSLALHALLEGRVVDAQSMLRTTLQQNPADGTAHQLLCRVFYAQDQAEAAIHECELAVANDPRSSESQMWLGRAYGMKASHTGPIAGFQLARRVKACFEAAVQLDPENVAAISDLGEYYVGAPAVVGGGDDKTRALAERTMPRFPAAAHRMLALLAESGKDLPTAEAEFKRAVATARGAEPQADAWIDLGHFYQTHRRPDEAVAAIRSGIAADRTRGPVLVDAASILTATHREPALAERCLRDYLAGHNLSDAAPAFKAHLDLARLLAARGATDEASRETAAAQALAPGFHAARAAQGM
jgi:tetratricopeptide (TPR) repeat protein